MSGRFERHNRLRIETEAVIGDAQDDRVSFVAQLDVHVRRVRMAERPATADEVVRREGTVVPDVGLLRILQSPFPQRLADGDEGEHNGYPGSRDAGPDRHVRRTSRASR